MTAALDSRAVTAAALAEDDQRLRPDDLRAAASAAPYAVDDLLEVVDVGDPQVPESIGIASEGERLDELWEVDDGGVDRVDLRSGTDAQLRRGGGEAARVFHEQVQDPVVDGVDIREGSVGRGSADDSVERLA